MNRAMLHDVLERLERHRQAATYGAVAGVVGGSQRSVMSNETQDGRSSWVVGKRTRRPTGYDPSNYHPDLLRSIETNGVLETPEELDAWFASHP